MRLSPLCLSALIVLFAGCSAPTHEMRPVPVAGGHLLGIPVGPNGPLNGAADGYMVLQSNTKPGKDPQEVIYQFTVSAPPGAAPARIQVEDISEEQSGPLLDDQHPWLTDNFWHMETQPLKKDDPRLAWVYTVTPTMRVYRITVTDKAGHQSIMNQVMMYPNYIKGIIRSQWGEKY